MRRYLLALIFLGLSTMMGSGISYLWILAMGYMAGRLWPNTECT